MCWWIGWRDSPLDGMSGAVGAYRSACCAFGCRRGSRVRRWLRVRGSYQGVSRRILRVRFKGMRLRESRHARKEPIQGCMRPFGLSCCRPAKVFAHLFSTRAKDQCQRRFKETTQSQLRLIPDIAQRGCPCPTSTTKFYAPRPQLGHAPVLWGFTSCHVTFSPKGPLANLSFNFEPSPSASASSSGTHLHRSMQNCSISGVQSRPPFSSTPAGMEMMASFNGVSPETLLPHTAQKLRVRGCPECVARSV